MEREDKAKVTIYKPRRQPTVAYDFNPLNAKAGSNIHVLPNEILLMIFDNLSVTTVVVFVQIVCRRWNSVGDLWLKKKIPANLVMTQWLEKHGIVHRFKHEYFSILSKLLVLNGSRITSISLTTNRFDSKYISLISKYCSNLNSLDTEYPNILRKFDVINLCQRCPDLKEFKFRTTKNFKLTALNTFFESTLLEVLNLSNSTAIVNTSLPLSVKKLKIKCEHHSLIDDDDDHILINNVKNSELYGNYNVYIVRW